MVWASEQLGLVLGKEWGRSGMASGLELVMGLGLVLATGSGWVLAMALVPELATGLG